MMTVSSPFSPDPLAFATEGEDRPSRWLVTVDHATNRVPDWVAGGSLGLPAGDMARHIAFDPGALGTGRVLAGMLEAPLVHSNFSRLVIDPNRGEDDPTLVMQLSDGSVIPANHAISPERVGARLTGLHRPYHAEIERLASRRADTAICAIHSFTPQLRGKPPRPWQVGILSVDSDRRLAEPLIAFLRAEGIATGDNEPYTGYLPGDSIDRHALPQHRPNVLIEIRNDLIADPEAEVLWAGTLRRALEHALAACGA